MGNKDTTTRSTTAPNQDAMAQYQALLQRAQGVANTPYQAYTGDLVAPVNAQQRAGIDNINSNSGFAFPYIQQAAGYANSAASPVTAQDIQYYTDPYTQRVIQATQNQFNNQNAVQQQGVVGNAASQGALGGDRVGVAQAQTAEAQQRAEAPVIAGLESQGYSQALAAAQNQKQMQAQGAYSLGNLGVAGQNAMLSGANAQIGAGNLMQNTDQQKLAAMYQQFQMQQAFPYQQTQWLAGLDTGVGSQMGGTSTTTPPPPNPWNTVAGLGMAGVGAFTGNPFMVAGGLGTAAKGFSARGGRISGFAEGGAPTMPYADASSWIPGSQITHGQGAPKPPGVGQPTAGVQKMVSDASAMANAMKRTPGVGAIQTGPSPEIGFGDGPIYRDGGIVNLPTTDRIMLPRGYDMGGTPTMAGFGGSMIPQSFGHTGNYQQVASSGVAPPGTVAPGAVTGPGGLDKTGVMPGGGVATPYNGGIVPPDQGGPYLGGMVGNPDIAGPGGPYMGGMGNNGLDRPPGMVTGTPIDQGWGNGVPDTRPLPPRDPGGIVPPGFDQAPGMVTGQPMPMGQPAQPPTGQPLPTQIGFPGSSSAGSGNMMGGSGRARGGFADGGSDDSLNPRNWLGFQTEDGGGGTFEPMTDRPPSVQKRPLAGFEDLPPEITGGRSFPSQGEYNFMDADADHRGGVGAHDPLAFADPEGPRSHAPQSGFGGPGLGQALMAAGFKMMSSRSPYFGVAAGEAGEAGLGAYTAGQTRALAEKRADATMARQAEQSSIANKGVELRAKALEQQADHWAKQLAEQSRLHNIQEENRKRQFEQGRVPPSYRMKDDGTMEPILGGPGDPAHQAKLAAAKLPSGGTIPEELRNVRGQEFLDALPPGEGDFIKKVANYEVDPKSLSTKGGHREDVFKKAIHYDDTFDQKRYNTIYNADNKFATGKQGDQIRSFNVGVSHLTTLEDAITALNNKDPTLYNKVANIIKNQLGYPEPNTFDAVKDIVGKEIIKAVVGAGGGVEERREAANYMNSAKSPAQLHDVINKYKELMGGQLKGFRYQYMEATGRPGEAFDRKLAPETVLHLNLKKGEGAASGAPTQAAPPKPQGVPDGFFFSPSLKLWGKPGSNERYDAEGKKQ